MCQRIYVIACEFDEETYIKMKKVFEVCNESGVSIPEEVLEYFDNNQPEENHVIEIPTIETPDGLEILIEDIPSKYYKIKILLNP